MFAFDHTFHNMSTQNHDLQVNLYFFEKKKIFLLIESLFSYKICLLIKINDTKKHDTMSQNKPISNVFKSKCLWDLNRIPLLKMLRKCFTCSLTYQFLHNVIIYREGIYKILHVRAKRPVMMQWKLFSHRGTSELDLIISYCSLHTV